MFLAEGYGCNLLRLPIFGNGNQKLLLRFRIQDAIGIVERIVYL